MGQCSTLPDQGGNNTSTSPKQYSAQVNYYQPRQARDDSQYHTRQTVDTRNVNDDLMEESSGDDSKTPLTSRMERQTTANMTSFLNVVRQSVDPFLNEQNKHHPSSMRNGSRVHPHREHEQGPLRPAAQPPKNAVRMRCYKLNLEASTVTQPGPMEHSECYFVQQTVSEDSSVASTRQIAVSTAKIFRGLSISRDGTITSRKMRGAQKGKQGEKSRQAAKIDKAKDLVEASVKGKKITHEEDETNMVSLVVMGEYDDMKHLVRDGSKKLREAQGLPDENLLSINRPRISSPTTATMMTHHADSRKRMYNPDLIQKSRLKVPPATPPSSVPPKLKSHPRDVPRSRANSSSSRGRFPTVPHQCSEFGIFGGADSDWSEALNFSKGFNSIWNCGATGETPEEKTKIPVNRNDGGDRKKSSRGESNAVSGRGRANDVILV